MTTTKKEMQEVNAQKGDTVDLGSTYGVIMVRAMCATDDWSWRNRDTILERRPDKVVTIKTDQIARRRFEFDAIARCCTSNESIVVDSDFIANLPAPLFRKLEKAFKDVNEINDDEEEAPSVKDEVGNSKTTR